MNATQPGGRRARLLRGARRASSRTGRKPRRRSAASPTPTRTRTHDQHPSCSVNVHSGAFNCHGCGAHGGAYDAALALGRSPREAIDLMVIARTDRPPPASRPRPARHLPHAAAPTEARSAIPSPAADGLQPPSGFVASCSGEDVRGWARALGDNDALLARLRAERGWEPDTLRRWAIGFDGERITVPITDQRGALQGAAAAARRRLAEAEGARRGRQPAGADPHPEPGCRIGRAGRGAERHARRPLGRAAGDRGPRNPRVARRMGQRVRRPRRDRRDGRRPPRARGRAQDRPRPRTARSASCGSSSSRPGRDDGYDLSDWLRAGQPPDRSAPRTGEEFRRMLGGARGRADAAPVSSSVTRGLAAAPAVRSGRERSR